MVLTSHVQSKYAMETQTQPHTTAQPTPVRHSLARAVARAVKRQAQQVVQGTSLYEEEEILLALIAGKDYKNDNECKNKLEKYCKELNEAKIDLTKIHVKLEGLCKNGKAKDKCTELKNKVEDKCTKFKPKLEEAAKKDVSKLQSSDCENEQQCLFLERACPTELKDDCNTLRNKCYQRKRDGVAEEVLLRALRGSIENGNKCKEKLKKICLELSQESDELTKLCLYQETTCSKFVSEKQKKCDALEQDVKAVLGKENKLRGKCLALLEQCYFYRGNCEEDKLKCDVLGKKCQEQNIVYIPPGPDFDPTRPEATLAEDIGLEELYKEAEKDGVHIGKPPVRDATVLLALLIQNPTNTQPEKKEKCKNVLKDKCKELKKHEVLGYLCNDNGSASQNGTEKCEELEKELANSAKILSAKIGTKHLSGSGETIPWYKLSTFLSDSDCARLESSCFYFAQDKGPLEKECKNFKAACYKRGLEALANEAFQSKMYGLFRGSGEKWFKKLLDKIMEECSELKTTSDELFLLCIDPLKAVRILAADIQTRAVFLRKQLDQKRDFPTDKDCKELGRKCQDLGEDSNQIQWPCHTLKQQCDRLGTTEILKQVLLDEHKDTLKDQESCVKYLKEKCNKWSRRGDDRFSFICVFQNATCKSMVDDVQDRCKVFKKNIEASEIIKFLKINKNEIKILERNCSSWYPYCNRFSPNCPDLAKENVFCTKIKKHCEPFYRRKALEDALKIELQGNLSDKSKCEPALERYCTVLENVTNTSIRGLCKDSTNDKPKKNDNKVRKELCEKLVKEVEQQCKVLQEKLKQPAKDLKEDSKTYEELKKQAEEAMNKSSLVLSFVKKDENNVPKNNSENNNKNKTASSKHQDTTEYAKILRRGVKDVTVTELEAKAFDLAAEVFGRYVDLKERCEKLTSDCGIKKDCKELEKVCGKIEKTCLDLKPLEVKPHETTTRNITTTTTTTTTTTVKDAKATDCQSLQTTDTWVTKTSTHTSTSTTTSTVTSRITLTSTRRCKPTKCTTGEEDEAGDVKPSEGLRMSGWSVMRGVLVVMMISFMI
ncbi:uncharacterized protein T551_03689 [Pneumocystis jirovecii RU7]|uniref:Major surface glycoprotein 2 C-terminal domain-containing protein n=2 Tax=Pneumocystis jirovecii TaxID=42068 RepID=A0A0W4ZBC0_PNEJ7|nr:uncharacterized protein T551_03689 [Pneumocystis jirovecii RU7]KTW25550.1 hypothetical protein T551_03689 [Pneumocystis jirovecii RU7]